MATRDAPAIVIVSPCDDTSNSDYLHGSFPGPDSVTKPTCTLPQPSITRSPRLKRIRRSWVRGDEVEEWSSGSESDPPNKRLRRSLSPIYNSSGRFSLGSLDIHPRLPRSSDNFFNFCSRPGLIFVDKTQCILDLPDKFQLLLLRPPRFGKTAFLSTLYHYYDIRGTTRYTEPFGSLAVAAKASGSGARHNHHLCLSFDLSNISVYSDMETIASRVIDDALDTFLIKYATELQISELQDFDDGILEHKFSKLFDRVQECHHTLFVGVDDYDAPTRSRSFPRDPFFKVFGTARDIEDLLDSCFWAPLMAGSHVIDKLLVTGSLYVKHPDLEQLDCMPSLQSACGFTEQEALHLAQSFFDQTPDMADIRRLCGQYTFASRDTERGVPVLHPQLLINRIRELSLPQLPVDAGLFQLLSDVLTLLPEKSDILGAITVNDLIELLATGVVEVGMEMDSAFDATKTITWSTLYYAGALTFDHQSTGTLRVANSAALSAIHSRVDTYFADRHELQWHFGTAWADFSDSEDPQLLPDLLTEVLRDLAQRSFGRKHEPNLRGVFELVMRNSDCSSLSHPSDPIILLPADVHRVQIPGFDPDVIVTMELGTLTLRGMWQATNLNDDEPTAEALETLHKELVELDEEALLARAYRVWSPERNAMETVLVGSFFDPKPKVSQLLAVGGARILLRKQRACEPEEDNAQNADAVNETDDDAGSRSRGRGRGPIVLSYLPQVCA
ncbi:hypothetical protein C8R47DRAFT_1238856 [Mycena vitilis]|nr:hypothetical protein C8R47DRAFT_1238856 [Mycena vitilis]